ncbi:MAG: hypothetical protein MI919_12235 [Holophagales bacterium]|nr:hypothetical protein [Holophagales bacterium]
MTSPDFPDTTPAPSPYPTDGAAVPVVGVMGSGRDEHSDLAEPLGRGIAEAGWHLLTGGGRGVMGAVTRAFCAVERRRGLAIGVLPGRFDGQVYRTKEGYPNPWVELPIPTHLWAPPGGEESAASRNHINVLASWVVVALPGSAGTAAEVRLALTYGRPVIAHVHDRHQIPGLEQLAVPATAHLPEVFRFVRRALRDPAPA